MSSRPRRLVEESGPRSDEDPDKKILREAYERFKRVFDWESQFIEQYIIDIKFANADSDNGWQWPEELRRWREVNKRPALTINKVQTHVALVTNDQRKNKPSISIKPTGNEGTFESAQIFEGIIRNIEYSSGAQAIYDEACESQVEGGIAYWRVKHQYIDNETWDQELIIAPVRSHIGVFLDCDILQKDGSDAKFGFIFDEQPRQEWEAEHPDEEMPPQTDGLMVGADWVRDDYIRKAEYYRIVETKDELIYAEDDQGHSETFRKSMIDKIPGANKLLKEAKVIKRRPIKDKQLEWYKIEGNTITARELKMPGKYIPIVRVIGKERIIERKLLRKGLTRDLKDPQRMYNYNSSGQVEYGALATKTPWVGPAAAFEGNENAWKNANINNAAYLTYKHIDENGDPIPAPQRPEAPGASPAFINGMQIAEREMAMASGQYEPQQGQQGNEISGVAIQQRQRQGDTSTYHFLDNLMLAIRHTGRILIDLIPKIYDTERVIKIMGKDGQESEVLISPQMQQGYQAKQMQDITKVLFNPNVGRYEVAADIGPSWATQRQEAFNAFVQIVTGNPDLINEIGDLMFQSADFPLADKIAERLRRKIQQVAPWLLSDAAPSPQVQALQQQVNQASQMIAAMLEKLGDQEKKLRNQERDIEIKAYDAESKRITAVSNAQPELERTGQIPELKKMVEQVLRDMQKTSIDQTPPVQGAQLAPDGSWYVKHPSGQFMKVANGRQPA